jgi:hypothetical protein
MQTMNVVSGFDLQISSKRRNLSGDSPNIVTMQNLIFGEKGLNFI